MMLRCLLPTIIEGEQRAFGEEFEASDPRLIGSLIESRVAEPADGVRCDAETPPAWVTRWR
jgi:hypothetical protein